METDLEPACLPGVSGVFQNKTVPLVTLIINIESLFKLNKKKNLLYQTNNTRVSNFFSMNNENVIFANSVDKTTGPIALKLKIPNVEFSVPEVSVDIPYYSLDCEDCIDETQLKNCKFEEVQGKKCRTVAGIKKCFPYWYYAPTKCAGQLGFVKYTIPKQVYFFVPGFAFNASFFLITPFDMESSFSFNYGGKLEINKPWQFLTNPENAFYMSFTITKLQIELTVYIKEMSFTYNNKTLFAIKDIEIPMFHRFDFCEGSNYISSTIDSSGNISAYYLVKSITIPMDKLLEIVPAVFEKVTEIINSTSITLVDMLGDPTFVEFVEKFGLATSQSLITFLLKTTVVTINIGILFCPSLESPFWLSLVGTMFVQNTMMATFVPQKVEFTCPISASQFDNVLERFPRQVRREFKTLIKGFINNFSQANKLVHPAALDFARNFTIPALLYHQYLPMIPKAPA